MIRTATGLRSLLGARLAAPSGHRFAVRPRFGATARAARALLTLLAAGALLAVAPAGADAGVRVATSGWEWGNPTPTGSSLAAVGFAGNRGYAAGAFGTVIGTDDAGATWRGLATGLQNPVTELQVLSPDVLIVGGGCGVRRSVDGGASFTRLYFTSPRCRESLTATAFTDANTGYLLLADGTVVGSTDGGATWSPKTPVPGTRAAGGRQAPTDLVFLSAATGVAATADGRIHRTTNGGGSWTLVSDTSRAVADLAFTDAATGFAVGADGLFLVTADGGATWTPRSTGADGIRLAWVGAASATSAIAVAERGDVLLRTADGGATFSRVTATPQAARAVAFASQSRVLAVGDDGAMAVSDDGGATFGPIGAPRLTGRFFVLRAGVNGAAFATGENGVLARTLDRGATWTPLGVPTSEDLLDVAFPTAQVGYAIDTDGRLFRSANTGASWAAVDTGTTARPAAVYAQGPRRVLLVGPTGVRRSTDGAETFATVRGAVSRTRVDEYDAATGAVFVYGRSALLRSTDGGRTFTPVRLPARRTKIRRADFVTARTGVLGDAAGRLFTTADGGRRWRELQGVGTTDWYGMSFSSARRGLLAIGRFGADRDLGYLLATEDGGATWAPQLVTDREIRGFGVVAGPTSYVLAGTDTLLSSTTGGRAGARSAVTLTPSSRRLRRPARIRVTIRVTGARPGDVAVVAGRRDGGGWTQQQVALDRSGRATTSWNLTKTTRFVGQWAGNESRAPDGSPPLTVEVGR